MRRIVAALAAFLLGCVAVFGATVAPTVQVISVSWDSNTTVANATIPLLIPQWINGGSILSVSYYTNGTSTPSFTADVEINGTGVTGCSAITVSSATAATTTCTGGNTFGFRSVLTLVISGVSGSPSQALVDITLNTAQN